MPVNNYICNTCQRVFSSDSLPHKPCSACNSIGFTRINYGIFRYKVLYGKKEIGGITRRSEIDGIDYESWAINSDMGHRGIDLSKDALLDVIEMYEGNHSYDMRMSVVELRRLRHLYPRVRKVVSLDLIKQLLKDADDFYLDQSKIKVFEEETGKEVKIR